MRFCIIILTLVSALFATTRAEFIWNGTAWTWKDTEATVQPRLEPADGIGKDQVSPTFHEYLFHMNIMHSDFLYLKLSFLLFLRKRIGRKVAPIMLVKLTIGLGTNPFGTK